MEPPSSHSCLYQCTLWHKRFLPQQHELLHRTFLFFLDLAELPHLPKRTFLGIPLLGIESPAIYSLRARDHFGKHHNSTLPKIIASSLQNHDFPPPAKSYLLAQLRFLGYVFNPLSIFFCFFEQKIPPVAIAQVTNTFGEQKLYLIPSSEQNPSFFHARQPKLFYISPFSSLDDILDFHIHFPEKHLRISVNTLSPSSSSTILRATLTGTQRPLTTQELLRQTLLCPFVTAKTILLIHWHALLLWKKKIPFSKKQHNSHLQQNILNPLPHLLKKTTPSSLL
ncbi:MAG: DUF1365 domain-containing protein [Chthoniobacterales bacterium]|nr:DUF1365 domain-containing protein [Chthoniobacterales bacterium]